MQTARLGMKSKSQQHLERQKGTKCVLQNKQGEQRLLGVAADGGSAMYDVSFSYG